MASITRRFLLGALPAALLPLRLDAATADTLTLRTSDGRDSAVSTFRARGTRKGTILFSHGAASAPWKYAPLTDAWSHAGYDVLAPLHVDSTDHPDHARYAGAASWPARIADMRALAASIGDRPYVAAGHSYGALMALTLGGAQPATPPDVTLPLRDRQARAVIAFSPPAALPGFIDAAGYAALAVPALIETGTLDTLPGMAPRWQDHLLAYESAAPGGDRYAVVLDGADHYFGGAICRPDLPGPKQTAQLAAATRISLLFLRAFGEHHDRRALDARLSDTGPVRLTRK